MTQPKLRIDAPLYLSGAPLEDLPQPVQSAVAAVKPAGGLVAGAIIGAVAGYFVPKMLDRFWPGPFGAERADGYELDIED